MKKLVAFGFWSFFFLNSIGFHIIFFYQRAIIRKEMKQRMQAPKKETELVFSRGDKQELNQLSWDGDDEFVLNGQRYDVIELRSEGDKLIIRCVPDENETALFNKANDTWKESDKTGKMAEHLFQMLQNLFQEPRTNEPEFIKLPTYNFHFYAGALPVWIKRIPTPPPQAI